jgi:phosphohistidine phosphatase
VSARSGNRRRLELYLLRHADAGDPEAWTAPDSARPLSPKGIAQSERLAALLKSVGFAPDAILTSPKIRAAETARIVGEALGVEVREDARLAGDVRLSALQDLVAGADVSRLMIVGHDPDFSELAGALSGTDDLPMRKGALCRVDLELPLRRGAGVLRWLVPPDLLRGKAD